jgi:hypothetical protein
MTEKSTEEYIKEIRQMWNPQEEKGGTIPNFLKMITSLPSTSMENIQPTRQAQPAPEATPENIGASLETPPGKLSKNYPY